MDCFSSTESRLDLQTIIDWTRFTKNSVQSLRPSLLKIWLVAQVGHRDVCHLEFSFLSHGEVFLS